MNIHEDEPNANAVVSLALETISRKKQALVFVNNKRSAEKCAEEIAHEIKAKDQTLDAISESLHSVLSTPTQQCERLAKVAKKGVAFHHAGLVQKQRAIIEDEFRKGTIKIICCTPTLAAGVDLPAFRAIIRDLRRYGHHGLSWIPVLEYHQQAGRAGRPSYDAYGEAITIATSDAERETIIERYIHGTPEDIFSKLAVEPVLRTYLLSLIAAGHITTEDRMLSFFGKTFWAHQFEDMPKLSKILYRVLSQLEKWEFIKTTSVTDDFVTADAISDRRLAPTLLGMRVAQLYLDPFTAYHLVTALRRAPSLLATPFSYLQMICFTLELRPLLSVKRKEWEEIQEILVKEHGSLLTLEPTLYDPEYETFLNSIKTALMLHEWTEEKDEEYILEKYGVRPGELRAKLDISDWLIYSSAELAGIIDHKSLVKDLAKLRVRLKYGVREELLPLLQLKNIGRRRARRLYMNKIRDIGEVKAADITALVQLLGKKIAIDVKRQVGEEHDEAKVAAKPHKRRGQISLNDFQ